MALFQRQERSEVANLYTMGSQKTFMVVGLGNIGRDYTGTRHNLGFAVVDYLAKHNDFPGWTEKKTLKSYVNIATIGQARVILVKPTTLMNLSGEAVQAVGQFYKVAPKDTLLIHDELDIPFGQLRSRTGGSAAGNNGIKSVIKHGYESAHRIRIGINNESNMPAEAFVLAKFTKEESELIPIIIREAASMTIEYVASGNLLPETRNIL